METMLNFIRTTKTNTGLRVRATLMKGEYPTGIRVAADAMDGLNIISHEVMPAWNYTITPRPGKM